MLRPPIFCLRNAKKKEHHMNPIKQLAHSIRNFLITPILTQNALGPQYSDSVTQLQLMLTYQALVQSGKKLPHLSDTGFKVFSQVDEDGILLFIFSVIGIKNKKSVEICAGNGMECNTANFIINHGWLGLLVDGNESLVKQGQTFYASHPKTYVRPPKFVHSWVTRDNINGLIKENDFEGEIDLFSLDMDGVDYWIWDAINIINPRVVVVEYQNIIGPEKSVTVPYQDDFNAYDYPTTRGMPNYCGASLAAFTKLANKRGYKLIGCNRYGYNAFFVRKDEDDDLLPEVTVAECFMPPFMPPMITEMEERFLLVKDLPWVEV